MLLLTCDTCDFQCLSYSSWIGHLLSRRHHANSKTKIWNWDLAQNERSLVVTRLKGVVETTKLCWQFAHYAVLTDFYLEDERDLCVVQLDDAHTVTGILNNIDGFFGCNLKKLDVFRKIDFMFSDLDVNHVLAVAEIEANSIEDSKIEKEMSLTNLSETQIEMEIKWNLHSKEFIADQLKELILSIELSKKEQEVRQQIYTELVEVVQKVTRDCTLEPFSTGFKYEVFHVNVELGKRNVGTNGANEYLCDVFEKIRKTLTNRNLHGVPFGKGLMNMRDLKFTRQLKFIHAKTYTRCRLSVSVQPTFTAYNWSLVFFMLELDPRVKPLLSLLLYWNNYYNNVTISYYVIFLLVIFFLGRKNILPSVRLLKELCKERKFVRNWNVSFCKDVEKVMDSFLNGEKKVTEFPQPQCILELAKEFFHTFAQANLKDNIVCVVENEFIPKLWFMSTEHEKLLPASMHSYVFLENGSRRGVTLWTDDVNDVGNCVIQSPIDLCTNATRTVTDASTLKFQILCSKTAGDLEKLLGSVKPNLLSVFPARND